MGVSIIRPHLFPASFLWASFLHFPFGCSQMGINPVLNKLSLSKDFTVIIAWEKDVLFPSPSLLQMLYLQTRNCGACVQLIHFPSNSRSDAEVGCKFNHSTCTEHQQNLIVKFVLLCLRDEKQKTLKWFVWAEYISVHKNRRQWNKCTRGLNSTTWNYHYF